MDTESLSSKHSNPPPLTINKYYDNLLRVIYDQWIVKKGDAPVLWVIEIPWRLGGAAALLKLVATALISDWQKKHNNPHSQLTGVNGRD